MAKKITRVTKKKNEDPEKTDIDSSDVPVVSTIPAKTVSGNPDTENKSIDDEIAEILGDSYKTESEQPKDEPPPEQPTKPVRRSRNKTVTPESFAPKKLIIPGRFVVKVTDKVFSRAICAVDAFFSKENAVDPGLLQMEDEDIDDDIIKMAEAMVQSWNVQDHPTLFFLGSMLLIQTTNLGMIKSMMRKQRLDEKRKNEGN